MRKSDDLQQKTIQKKSPDTLKKQGLGYAKLPESEEAANASQSDKVIKKPHEIYDNTYYLSHQKTKIIETQISSSLPLQILIYYNFFFSILYSIVAITTALYKVFS